MSSVSTKTTTTPTTQPRPILKKSSVSSAISVIKKQGGPQFYSGNEFQQQSIDETDEDLEENTTSLIYNQAKKITIHPHKASIKFHKPENDDSQSSINDDLSTEKSSSSSSVAKIKSLLKQSSLTSDTRSTAKQTVSANLSKRHSISNAYIMHNKEIDVQVINSVVRSIQSFIDDFKMINNLPDNQKDSYIMTNILLKSQFLTKLKRFLLGNSANENRSYACELGVSLSEPIMYGAKNLWLKNNESEKAKIPESKSTYVLNKNKLNQKMLKRFNFQNGIAEFSATY
jgi:hypothetical protein